MSIVEAALTAAVESNRSGFPGSMRADILPTGWVQVAYFPYPNNPELKDVTTEYVGPLLEENDDYLLIDVFGSSMTFPKDRVLITRPDAR